MITTTKPLNQNKMKRNRLWLMLGVIFIIFLSNMPKREKHESKVKIQYGNYERLPDRYYELP